MLFLDCIMLMRYISIFWLKNPAAFQDEFWSLFANLWVVTFSWISQFVFDVMLGQDNYHIHICTGHPPILIENKSKLSKAISFNNILRILTVLINFGIFIRIQAYKYKNPAQKDVHPRSKFSWLIGLENKMLSDFTTNIITAICLLLIGVSQLQITFSNLADMNRYPNYLYEYFYRMIRVPLMFNLIVLILFVRNNLLRKTVLRELQSFKENLFSGNNTIYCDV